MKAILSKEGRGYYNLYNEKRLVIGTSYDFTSSVGDVIEHELSQQNCDEIFGVVDVDKLAKEHSKSIWGNDDDNIGYGSYYEGFHKAMELNKDKLYTAEDVYYMFQLGFSLNGKAISKLEYETHLESLQQPTEIEVEIQQTLQVRHGVEWHDIPNQKSGNDPEGIYQYVNKLDSNGCLILNKINHG
jgi:hypothetical protein